jgi:hypothetical protein
MFNMLLVGLKLMMFATLIVVGLAAVVLASGAVHTAVANASKL